MAARARTHTSQIMRFGGQLPPISSCVLASFGLLLNLFSSFSSSASVMPPAQHAEENCFVFLSSWQKKHAKSGGWSSTNFLSPSLHLGGQSGARACRHGSRWSKGGGNSRPNCNRCSSHFGSVLFMNNVPLARTGSGKGATTRNMANPMRNGSVMKRTGSRGKGSDDGKRTQDASSKVGETGGAGLALSHFVLEYTSNVS